MWVYVLMAYLYQNLIEIKDAYESAVGRYFSDSNKSHNVATQQKVREEKKLRLLSLSL